jgi:molybdopterin molybdotransferase
MLSVAEARARILKGILPVTCETVALSDSLMRVLASPVKALRTQPPFDMSAMDGYAVRAADVEAGGPLTVIGQSQAGLGFNGDLKPGQAVRIFTGAPVPPGADAILIQEDAERAGETIVARARVSDRQYIRPKGLDFREGDTLFAPGHRLSARDLGLAAGLGHAALPLRRRPVMAILATGDELVPPGVMPVGDEIIATSSVALAALVQAEGAQAHDLGIVRDEEDALQAAVAAVRELRPDVLVTLGGASVGDHDLVRKVFEQQGLDLDFWKIAMRPGKPLISGRLDGIPTLGLPGNPVSAQVCALLFLKPLLRALLGRRDVEPLLEPAILGCGLPANGRREDYMRASLSEDAAGRLTVFPFEAQDSSMTRLFAQADALLVRAPDEPAAQKGDACRILRLDETC